MISVKDERYMERCFELALMGLGQTGTNPIVGAVLVYQNRIIGEGYHQIQGGAHAEVNAIKNISSKDKKYISKSHLYVSLEPCNHFGKTPPCSHLIANCKIPMLSISVLDPNPFVKGMGIHYLQKHGVYVQTGILKEKGAQLIRPFKISSQFLRPYIIIKSAISEDGFIGVAGKRIQLSGPETTKLVHKWRTQIDGIMVGTNTAITDNPLLTVREYNGKNPLRIIMDWNERIPKSHHLLADSERTLVFTAENKYKEFKANNKEVIHLSNNKKTLDNILKNLFDIGIGILMVEGGSMLIQSFIEDNLWDEARIVKTPVVLNSGIKLPAIKGYLEKTTASDKDSIAFILNNTVEA